VRRPLVVTPLLIVLALAAGCGEPGTMSTSDYREAISDLHDRVALDLGEAIDVLSSVSYDDYYDLVDLQGVFEEISGVFTAAEAEAGSMRPPSEYRDLHGDFLLFYAEGRETAGNIAAAIAFTEDMLLMLTEVENLALSALPETAGFEEIKSATAEDLRIIGSDLEGLEGREPPEELAYLYEGLMELLRSIDEAVRAVDAAVTPEDSGPFLRFRQEFSSFLQARDSLWAEAQAYLRGLPQVVDMVIDRGTQLAKSIPAPPAPPAGGGEMPGG